MAIHPSAWGLIIAGVVLLIVGYVMWQAIPWPHPTEFLALIGMILFYLGVILLVIGIILLVIGLVRGATGT